MPAGRISLWRTPRARSLLLLGLLGLLGGAVSLLAHVYTDLLWFRELGQERALWTTLKWQVLGRAVPGFGTAAFLLVNFAAVERVMASAAPLRPQRRLAYPVAAVAAGLIVSQWRTGDGWQLLALWTGRSDFGVDDPLFDRDVGFFVFSLPLYQQAARWLLETIAMAGVATIAAYLAAGGLRRTRPYLAVRAARGHLLTLAALALVVMAWRYRLDQFALALPHTGSELPGAGYTEAHVRLPALWILVGVSLAGALLSLYAAARRVLLVPCSAALALATLALVGPGAASGLVERFDVEPQKLTRERPYLEDAIAATRRAFALDSIAVRPATGSRSLSAREIAGNRRTLDNVPLWDESVLRPAMDDLQSIGRYYSFPSTTVDRYSVDGVPQVLTIAARQLDLGGLGPDARGWTNDRFAYTHGYGVVAVSATRTHASGQPRFAQGDFDARPNPLGLRQPRVYFSEQDDADPPYLVVQSSRAEVDGPLPGSRHSDYHYDGPGGIPLSDTGSRLAFAARFGDLNLLLSESVTDRSRLVLHRNVGDRVRKLAPFVHWDSQPETAVIDGHVKFLFHGYTASSHYPYSAPVRFDGSQVNYLRASAHAVIDAFSGEVTMYAADDDPIIRAWQAVYRGLFLPASQMPAEVLAHLRYPERLFDVQAAAYATYHADDPTGFWNGADAWQLPRQLAGPVEVAGEIRFPQPEEQVDADQQREGQIAPYDWQMQPSYLLGRLPGDPSERLMLVTGFTARGRENLVSYLAGSIDERGRPRLTLLSLPRDRLTVGPSQATRRILTDAGVISRLELLNKESRDLGKAAVDRTILGAPRLLPVGDALVYIQPVYLTAGGHGVPRLQLVTAYAGGRVGYGRDLEAALRRTVGSRAR